MILLKLDSNMRRHLAHGIASPAPFGKANAMQRNQEIFALNGPALRPETQ